MSLSSLQGVPIYRVACDQRGLAVVEQTDISTAPPAPLFLELLSWVFASEAALAQNLASTWQLKQMTEAREGFKAGVLAISVRYQQLGPERIIAEFNDLESQRSLRVNIKGIEDVLPQ